MKNENDDLKNYDTKMTNLAGKLNKLVQVFQYKIGKLCALLRIYKVIHVEKPEDTLFFIRIQKFCLRLNILKIFKTFGQISALIFL